MHTWQNDWSSFVVDVCRLMDNHVSEQDISDQFCDTPVQWKGTVLHYSFSDGEPFFVQLAMPQVVIDLKDGRKCITDFLCVRVEPADLAIWTPPEIGSLISFRTEIERNTGIPFNSPGIRWAWIDEDTAKGYLEIMAHKSLPLP